LFNLLDNAHKYSPPSSVTRIAALTLSGGEGVRITVTDDGIGIPAEALSKIFDKFYRVAGGDGRAPGTGLGLSICAALVAAMGGTISARSPAESGKGSEFEIVLPAGQTETAPQRDSREDA
jgi:two-component system sensor histidine kinase KdpD